MIKKNIVANTSDRLRQARIKSRQTNQPNID
jgi:hypothetical protein